MLAPVRGEDVLADHTGSGSGVDHRGNRDRLPVPYTQGGLDLEGILTQNDQGTPIGTECPGSDPVLESLAAPVQKRTWTLRGDTLAGVPGEGA